MKELRDIIRFWDERRTQPLALATLVQVSGSSYRRPGARMLISASKDFAGGLSAGCIEEQVVACASEVLRTGISQLMRFDTRLRFGCHGVIDIFVEPVDAQVMAGLREHFLRREPCRMATAWHGEKRGTRVARENESEGPEVFVQAIEPVVRLMLVGDSAEIGVLRAHGALLGWEVVTVDTWAGPREMLDSRTAVVLATHNFAHDHAALRDLLPAGLKYLGLVGSRRRREDLLFDLMQNSVEFNSALFAPAGLHLGADSPEEIALSIAAEVQCVFGDGTGQHLCDRKAPVHQPLSKVFA